MKNTIAVTPGHTLLFWRHGGTPVIAPLHELSNGEARGGIPLCVPQFSVQQRAVTGCKLPLHGLLMYSDHGTTTHNAQTDTITIVSNFKATATFAWQHTVTTHIKETADSLSYDITIKRSADCTNPEQMPLSLGFHPYFATHDKDFSFSIGDQDWTKDTLPQNIVDSAFHPNPTGTVVTLQTSAHTITMTNTGFDEYCLWTDDASTYICIEPIWQYQEFGLPGTGLQLGEEKVVTIRLQATPK